MAKNEYIGNGASLESALQNLYQNINSDGFGEDRLGQIDYLVKLFDKKGEIGNSRGQHFDSAYFDALKDAGIGPADYNPKNHKLEVSAYASLKAEHKDEARQVRASGCDGSKNYKTTLTDLF